MATDDQGTRRLDLERYHLLELEIAKNPADPRHIIPDPGAPGDKILDIGCGAGQTLIAAFPGCVTYGIDLDMDALRLGMELTQKVRFVCGSAEHLPFRDGTFDRVISRVALPYTEVLTSLREIRRVLRSGGKVWMILHSLPLMWTLWQAESTPWSHRIYVLFNSILFHCVQRTFPKRGRRESCQTNYGIRRALERAGFEHVMIAQTKHFLVTAVAK